MLRAFSTYLGEVASLASFFERRTSSPAGLRRHERDAGLQQQAEDDGSVNTLLAALVEKLIRTPVLASKCPGNR
jgi:hypothetical protein